MQGHKMYKLGISIAASWAWGVSLGVSHSILQTMGLSAFIPWAIANTLAPFVFGAFVRKYPEYLEFRHNQAVKAAMIGIQIFCIWINVKIMGSYIGNTSSTLITLVVFILTYLYRFPFTIKSNFWQYATFISALALIIITGKASSVQLASEPINLSWVIPACLGLMAGPFLDGQQHQRAQETDSIKPWMIGSACFGFYLFLVFLTFFANSPFSRILLAITIIAVATSTLNSSVSALQNLAGNKWAIIISLTALVFWPLFLNNTAVQIWTWYATGRIFVVIPMIVCTIRRCRKWNNGKKTNTL